MAAYPQLVKLLGNIDPSNPRNPYAAEVIPYLCDVWVDDYARAGPISGLVETMDSGFSYLFDTDAQRLVAAWGVSAGRASHVRDKSRMAGSPLSAGPKYHRGHAIPHTLGGSTDINLVPQLGAINVGAFRPLEKKAVATPGSFYFTYWTYFGALPTKGGFPGQKPTGVDQGLLIPGQQPQITRHGN